MSEDRLERALQEMRDETVDEGTLAAARARVWDDIAGAAGATCAEFRPAFQAYIDGTLAGPRRLLLDDHLSRCTACRAVIAAMKGQRPVIPMPQRNPSRVRRWGVLAAAAALAFAMLYSGRDVIDAFMAPDGPRATVVAASGGLYRVPGEAAAAGDQLAAGETIAEGEIIRTAPGAHAVLQLMDGSTVDVNERTELSASAVWSGQAIHLQRGDVIVKAARQRRGHLRVLTRDSIVSVRGTVFAVSASLGGSVVSVVEGSVAVRQPGTDVLLSPGQQVASNAALASSVEEAIAWSPEADEYLALLGSFVRIERQLAENSSGELRTNSALLPYLPGGAFLYGAVPNLAGTIGQALALAEQQAAENTAFATWWTSDTGRLLKQMVERVQSVTSLLGEEVVFCATADAGVEVPLVLARVQPGRRAELEQALTELIAAAGASASSEGALAYSVSDDLMVVSNSQAHVAWALGRLGQGAGSPFAGAISERYQRGAGWLIGIDTAAVVASAGDGDVPSIELAGLSGLQYAFLEQRAPAGAAENEVTLMFQGARTGMASWLAESGSGGAAEYLAADALLAGYVSLREPWQLFQEFTALVTRHGESFADDLAEVDEKLGAGFIQDLTAAMGTEAAFAVNGFSLTGPRWLMTVLANDPVTIDSSIRKVSDAINSDLAADEQDKRIVVTQESVGGRVWTTAKLASLPIGMTWTYDGGFMVAASDRATAERAIATRHGGSPLVWSPEFLGQLPASTGAHPSAFVWLNTKGAFEMFSALAPSPALGRLLAERDPVLVIFDGKPEQIRAASRTRVSGVIMDLMLLDSLTRTRAGLQTDVLRQ